MDDVMFAHKPRLLDVTAQLKRSSHAALGLGYKLRTMIPVAGQRPHGTTFRALTITSQMATRGWSLRSMTALLPLWRILFICLCVCWSRPSVLETNEPTEIQLDSSGPKKPCGWRPTKKNILYHRQPLQQPVNIVHMVNVIRKLA